MFLKNELLNRMMHISEIFESEVYAEGSKVDSDVIIPVTVQRKESNYE